MNAFKYTWSDAYGNRGTLWRCGRCPEDLEYHNFESFMRHCIESSTCHRDIIASALNNP